ncbi:GntR family transcriptional regulator [Streptomyces sp. NHF165]|uniref:GntR family transcriptional regulator n=1 Tax=Streptomyces sp. NHF165 TaxID=2175864 RepID=UPI00132EAAEB|nr:GntR family transcriptional regulator [Streptomyces sp. NHF165]QHF97965.1 GntR family transcriptional regulator [Streptomyces sp. NHF165]
MIRRSTLRSQIASALRDEILAGRLATGRPFTVKEIAEQYGVSATPVREALVDLAAQGLLDIEQHRGFRVREYTLQDYREMCDARRLVVDSLFRDDGPGPRSGADAGAGSGSEAGDGAGSDAGGAAGAGSSGGARTGPLSAVDPAALASVRRRADAAQRAARAGDLDVLIAYDLRFWRELSGLLGNSHICDFLDRLRVQCWVYAVPQLRARPRLCGRLWAGHGALLDAVEAGDGAAAREIIASYDAHALAQVEEAAGEVRGRPDEGPEGP